MIEKYEEALWERGFDTRRLEHDGRPLVDATMTLERGREIKVICNAHGTARIDKPNGTHKWVYDKSPAQLAAIMQQIIECNRPRRGGTR